MDNLVALSATLHGHVQGVFFRAFVRQQAQSLGIVGYVRNSPVGTSLEVKAEGKSISVKQLLRRLHIGPPGARVDRIEIEWSEFSNRFDDFEIRY